MQKEKYKVKNGNCVDLTRPRILHFALCIIYFAFTF